MKREILAMAFLATFSLVSCNETPKQAKSEATTEAVEKTTDEIVTSTSTDAKGNKLEMSFNNTKDMATVTFNGETIELVGQKPASGMWYKNDHYELIGSGESVELKKDGNTVFQHEEATGAEATGDNWFEGKDFTSSQPAGHNPEEGGPNFLKIGNDGTADYKTGDIVNAVTWATDGDKLILTDKVMKRKTIFKIGDQFLTDEYGTKWTIKK